MKNGEYMKKLREQQGLSLASVARKANVTDSRISHLESNSVHEPSPTLLKKLAAIYGIDLFDLFYRYGYLDKSHYESLRPFSGVEYLTATDKEYIQVQIEFCLFQARRKQNETVQNG